MTGPLRLYTKAECEEWTARMRQGPRPLDWERCRTCEGAGEVDAGDEGGGVMDGPLRPVFLPCPTCGGYGSLRAMARIVAIHQGLYSPVAWSDYLRGAEKGRYPARCEDCSHPMSDGTWDGPAVEVMGDGLGQVSAERMVEDWIEQQHDPKRVRYNADFWSACDEGCKHGIDAGARIKPRPVELGGPRPGSASWRQVDVRTLGWAFDLSRSNLAILCLRCWMARG